MRRPSTRRNRSIHGLIRVAFSFALVLAGLAAPCRAADRVWDQPAFGVFSFGSSWQGGVAPGVGELALFGATLTTVFNPITVQFNLDATAQEAVVESGDYSFNLTPNGGSVFTLSGLLDIGTRTSAVDPGLPGVATLRLSGNGVLNTGTGGLRLGVDRGFGTRVGELFVSNGFSLSDSSYIAVGQRGVGRMEVSSGAQVLAAGGNALIIGHHAGSNGTTIVRNSGTFVDVLGILSIGVESGATGSLEIRNGGKARHVYLGICPGGGQGTMLIDGPGSEYEAVGQFWLGNGLNASGGVTVRNGGRLLTRDYVGIHGAAPGNGNIGVLITGPGTRWDGPTGWILVGSSGAATVTVDQGADAAVSAIVMGSSATGRGSLVVRDPGTTWSTRHNIYVGENGGLGELRISNGGQVHSSIEGHWTAIGIAPGSLGAATVTGNGSSWTTDRDLRIGQNGGSGELSILLGADVTTAYWGYVGVEPGSDGLAIVNGAGSTWSMPGELNVGMNGAALGELRVENGAQVASGVGTSWSAVVGRNNGATGTATVTGVGSTWSSGYQMHVGLNNASGSLYIQNGGAVTALVGGQIGQDNSASGLLHVSGSGSSFTVAQEINVGLNSGQGQLLIQNGALASNGWSAHIGRDNGAIGTATVTGAGSTWNTLDGSLVLGIGAGSDGTLTVQSGASINVAHRVIVGETGGAGEMLVQGGADVTNGWESYVGNHSGSVGIATITGAGSTWESNGGINIGNDTGSGVLSVLQGGSFAASAGTGNIGVTAAGLGELEVTGTGSTFTVAHEINVGFNSGQGQLLIQNGALASNGWSAHIGRDTGAIGTATVTGAGSTWTTGGDMVVGVCGGSGELHVLDGGSVSTSWGGHIGRDCGGAVGVVTVSGTGSTWSLQRSVEVGRNDGTGTLNILNGGQVNSSLEGGWIAQIGGNSLAVGTVVVRDPGSRWDSAAGLWVGANGQGQLSIENGGTLSVFNKLELGVFAGSNGSVTVRDNGSEVLISGPDDNIWVGARTAGTLNKLDRGRGVCRPAGGSASLLVGGDGSGQVTLSGSGSRLEASEYVALGNPTSNLSVSSGAVVATPNMYIYASGVLAGAGGTISGTVSNSGRIAPGASAGTLAVTGALFNNWGPPGTIEIEVGGPSPGTQHDVLTIGGAASLQGSILDVRFINGFSPAPGATFDVILAGSVTGPFASVLGVEQLGGNKLISVEYLADRVRLVVTQMTGLDIAPLSLSLYHGFPLQMTATATVLPSGTVDVTQSAAWSSDNPSIASVSPTGLVRGESPGSTTIRCSQFGFNASAPVTVLALPASLSTNRVSTDSAGMQGDDGSGVFSSVKVTPDGRLAAFESLATNLVPGDMNGSPDVFVKDRMTGQTTRVSTSQSGEQGNSESAYPAMSASGRYVAFNSFASNLIAADANNQPDVFRKDLVTGEVLLVSAKADGSQGAGATRWSAISSDGRFVAFFSSSHDLAPGGESCATNVWHIYLKDMQTGAVVRVTTGPGEACPDGRTFGPPSITPDGRYIQFSSNVSNLVPDDTNLAEDVFRFDRLTAGIVRVSTDAAGLQGDATSIIHNNEQRMSDDGRFSVFLSDASNLVPGDTNGTRDVFVKDLVTGDIRRVNLTPGGGQSVGGDTGSVSISGNGRFVAFRSPASDLVPDDTNNQSDIFRADLATGEIQRMSLSFFGGESDGYSAWAVVTRDGSAVFFRSEATNLASFDTNNVSDVFYRAAGATCPGDAGIDDQVSFADITLVLRDWGATYPAGMSGSGDANRDGAVNFADLTSVLRDWSADCRFTGFPPARPVAEGETIPALPVKEHTPMLPVPPIPEDRRFGSPDPAMPRGREGS